MKHTRASGIRWGLFLLALLAARGASAQGPLSGIEAPLTIQGMDRGSLASASSRGAGGITFGIRNDAGLMFSTPAALQSLAAVSVSLGGMRQSTSATQVQQYTPLKYYPNFSLLMEGLTDRIGDPDPSRPGVRFTDAGDTVQRPFDTLGPNWSRSRSRVLPIQALAAVPFTIGESRFVAAIGAVEYANLDVYSRNNNVLSPAIGSERPIPVNLPLTDSLPVVAQWWQYTRLREGSIRGYGGALSAAIGSSMALGISGMVLTGSSDDQESRLGRGQLTFYRNYFRATPLSSRSLIAGTSDYSGLELTFSGIYRGKSLTLGFSVRPPATITRTFRMAVQTWEPGSMTASTRVVEGNDKVKLPWRGTVGLALAPLPALHLGLEYEVRSYASAVYTAAGGAASHPWLSASVLHVGAEFSAAPWLALRAGVRGQGEVFEPEGNPLPGEPVTSMVYSAGCGFSFAGIHLNLAYEYSRLTYEEMLLTNVTFNNETRHVIAADVAYEIPWLH